MGNIRIDITGQRFGRLTAVKISKIVDRKAYWECLCDCGNVVNIRGSSLRSGATVSCGCYRKTKGIRHGESHKTRLYSVWLNMRNRCNNPNGQDYKHYGGRGIVVCQEWDDYPTFKEWSLSNGYAKNLTIERIDNSGPYAPNNCRWATRAEQSRNTRANLMIEIAGKIHCAADWAKMLKIKSPTFYDRIRKGRAHEDWIIRRGCDEGAHISKNF